MRAKRELENKAKGVRGRYHEKKVVTALCDVYSDKNESRQCERGLWVIVWCYAQY